MRTAVCLYCALYGSLLRAGMANEPMFTAYGTIEYQSYVSRRYYARYDFIITVSNRCWGIQTIQTDKQTGIVRSVQTFDGSAVTAKFYNTKERSQFNDGVVTVQRGEVPCVGHPGNAEIIWAAYASSHYLRSVATNRLLPIWLVDLKRLGTNFTVEAKWSLFEAPPGLPQQISYFYEPELWGHRSESSSGRKRIIGRFDASEFAELGNLGIPQQFSYTAFDEQAQTVTNSIRFKISGAATSVTTNILADLLNPSFKGIAAVEDRRFLDGKRESGVRYFITNSAPPPTNDETVVLLLAGQDFQSKLIHESQTTHDTQATNPRSIKILLAGLIVVTSGILFYSARNRAGIKPLAKG